MLRGALGIYGCFLGLPLMILGAIVFVAGQAGVVVALLVHLGTSRQREWLADAKSAQVTSRPLALAHALERLGQQRRPLIRGRRMAQAICFVGEPRTGSWWKDILSTHPPLDERIDRRYGYAGRARSR
ncbi:MAG: M48 family metalloprotease [Thermoleophilia bacterium]